MKKLIILAVLAFGAYQVWVKYGDSVQPIYDEPYIAVYGRDSCGFTQRTLSEIRASGANYHYFSVDDRNVADTLHARMESAGISTRRYNLPVVDVNGDISVRPAVSEALSKYHEQR